jgi:class 3 adenylate cyclase
LQAHVDDLLAVIDRVGAERVALYGRWLLGPLAIAFAHQHPERLSHLILGATIARGEDIFETGRFRALMALMENDWELYTSVTAMILAGWSEPDVTSRMAAQMRAGTTPERVRRARDAMHMWDTTPLLANIGVRTLVLDFQGGWLPADEIARQARRLAGGIPAAQLLVLDEPAAPERSASRLPEGTAIILFADIVDSTALTEQLGDAAFRKRASGLDDVMRSDIRDCGGTPIDGKVLGDGVMAVFSSARQAIDAAFRCRAAADGTGLALHLGIHAGDVTREGANVYGGAVNIASRMCELSTPNEIVVSATVRELARTSAGVMFEDRGEHALKGIAEPVRVFAVRKASV